VKPAFSAKSLLTADATASRWPFRDRGIAFA
jgi:hypothetical protein